MSQTLRRRIKQLEQNAAPEGYWFLPLAYFYGEDVKPVWVESTTRQGLDDFYRDIQRTPEDAPAQQSKVD